MYLASSPDRAILARQVARFRHHRCFVMALQPDGTLHLYAGATCHDAKIAAVEDHPLTVAVQEVEYLPPAVVEALRHPQDPIAQAFSYLGLQH